MFLRVGIENLAYLVTAGGDGDKVVDKPVLIWIIAGVGSVIDV